MKSHLLSDPRLSAISHHDPTIAFLAPAPSHLTAKLEHVDSHSDPNLLLDDIDNDQTISHGNMMIKRRNKRKQVKQACINCRSAHAGCEDKRPCSRCIRVGKELSCADVPRKKRSCQKRNITVIVNKGFHHTQTTEHSITNVNEMNSSSSQYISMDGGSSFLTNRDILNALQLKDFSQEHLTGSTLIPVYRQVTSNVLSCHMNPARASAFVPLSYNAVPSCISVPSHTSTNTNSNTAASRKDHWGNEDSYYEQRALYNHIHNQNQNHNHNSTYQDNDYQDRRFSPGTANRDENACSSAPSKGLKRKAENIIITQNNTTTNNNNNNRILYVDHANNYHSVQNEEVSHSVSTSSLSNDKEVEKRPRKRARSDPNISYSRRSVTDDTLEEREIFHNHNHNNSEDNNNHFNTTPNTSIKTIVIDEDIDEDSSPRTQSHPTSPLQTSSPIHHHHNNIDNINDRKLQPIHTILNEAPSPSRIGSKLNTDKRNITSSSSSDSSSSSHNLLPRIILPPLGGDLYSTGSIILPTSVSGLQGITYYTGPTLQHSHHSQLTMATPVCLSYNIPI